jgi:hypothetical protein
MLPGGAQAVGHKPYSEKQIDMFNCHTLSAKILLKGRLLKGILRLFAIKTSQGKKVLCKIHRNSPFQCNQAEKTPRFTGIIKAVNRHKKG